MHFESAVLAASGRSILISSTRLVQNLASIGTSLFWGGGGGGAVVGEVGDIVGPGLRVGF